MHTTSVFYRCIQITYFNLWLFKYDMLFVVIHVSPNCLQQKFHLYQLACTIETIPFLFAFSLKPLLNLSFHSTQHTQTRLYVFKNFLYCHFFKTVSDDADTQTRWSWLVVDKSLWRIFINRWMFNQSSFLLIRFIFFLVLSS